MQRPASVYFDVPALRPGTIGAYALAVLCAGLATAVRVVINPYVTDFQYVTFFPAVIITTLIGGFGAGLCCGVLNVAAVMFFVIPPRFSFHLGNPAEVPTLLLFILVTFSTVILIGGMRFAIERREEALQGSKDRLQLALDTAQLGWWRYDPRSRMVSGDTRFKEIFDVTDDELPVEDIKKLVHPDDSERFLSDREASIDPANPRRSSREYRVRRRDGVVRWVEVRWLAYFDGDRGGRETANVVGTVHDVTERKEREERERLLMREVNHRTKNMLSVVDAIAHQTAIKNPEDFIERFSERIRALAANQDLLIRNAWHGIEIADLVRAQLAPFADLIGSRIAAHGPKLRLRTSSAQAVGLALNELATNAGKYGALSTDRGRVGIRWAADHRAFTMSWIEREGPPVSRPKHRGFGTTIMTKMTERSLGGTVDLDYAPSGLTWRLTCPAANMLESNQTETLMPG